MDRDWLLRGRLRPPSYRVALLPTPALMRLDAQGSEHKVVLVTAPAGYGKTALLARFLKESGENTFRLQPFIRSSNDTLDPTGHVHIDRFTITGPLRAASRSSTSVLS